MQIKFKFYKPNLKVVNDCTVRSLAQASGRTYQEVFKEIKLLQRIHRKHYYYDPLVVNKYIKRENFTPVKLKKVYNIESFLLSNPPGRYIFSIRGHLSVAIGNIIYDTWDCRKERVYKVWAYEDGSQEDK